MEYKGKIKVKAMCLLLHKGRVLVADATTLRGVGSTRKIVPGDKGHEIVFLFSGELSSKELCEQEVIHVIEDDYKFDARWVPIDDLIAGDKPLYPSLDYRIVFSKLGIY